MSKAATDNPHELPDIDKNLPWPQVNKDLIRVLTAHGWRWWTWFSIAVTMLLISLGTFYYMSTVGLGLLGEDNGVFWGLDMPAFIFWIGLSHAGTFLSAVLFLTKSHWRRPVYRYAEGMTLFSLLNVLLILMFHLGRPWRMPFGMPLPNSRHIWMSFRSPLAWDIIAITTYLSGSALFLYLGMVPDFGGLRDHVDKKKHWIKHAIFNAASLGWKGSDKEWKFLLQAYSIIGAMIIPLMASVHSLVAWDFVSTNVPGFHNTMFAPFFVEGALYSGIAGVISIVAVARKYFHFEDYIKKTHFDKMGKLMLCLAFVWIYFQLVEAWGSWYKQDSFEAAPYIAKAIGPWAPLFWFMWFSCGALPMVLFSRRVRTNIPLMFSLAMVINVGMFIERFMIIIPGQSITHLPTVWRDYAPTVVELLVYVGIPVSLFSTLFLLFLKVVPHMSLYEIKEILHVPVREPALAVAHGGTGGHGPREPLEPLEEVSETQLAPPDEGEGEGYQEPTK